MTNFISAFSLFKDTKEDDLPTPQALEVWLNTAPPGAQLCYATGVFLSEERQAVAKAAYKGFESGLVELCQRRPADGTSFDYIAQKRKEIIRPFQPPTLRGDVRKG